jgi:hypothetical protein
MDIDPASITSRRVGRVLGQLRLKKDADTSQRAWKTTCSELARLAVSFGVVSPSVSESQPETEAVFGEKKENPTAVADDSPITTGANKLENSDADPPLSNAGDVGNAGPAPSSSGAGVLVAPREVERIAWCTQCRRWECQLPEMHRERGYFREIGE